MDERNETTQTPSVENVRSASPAVSRRALLSGAGQAAIPAIVTLYSGAALARSSNLIGVNASQGAQQGKYRCLDSSSVYPTEKANVYDLGEDPMAHVTRIDATKTYYRSDYRGNLTGQQATGDAMCTSGGQYYRKDFSGYKRVTVRKGMLVSATALGSFSNDITYTDV